MRGSQGLSNNSLETLQSDDARSVMDTVDRLRKTGLSSIVQLPQIVTVGDQSLGKSSTLEAITGVLFPRKENLCTRFATQIVMRRAKTESVSINIIPDKLRPREERVKLSDLHLTLENFDKLGDLIDQATNAMGLGEQKGKVTRAFSRDVLNIEISRPSRPHLTLVDLPGLIHSENKQQSREDVSLITSLVDEYIKEKRTIVLAIVSAKNDIANQIVLRKTCDLGAADRTLSVVTKVDVLEADSKNEKSWIELAENKDVHYSLGWAMVRNRTPKEMNSTLKERDSNEEIFFSQGRYRQLDREILGVHNLRLRLSKLLFDHLTNELPGLQRELIEKRNAAATEIEQLGESRATPEERLRYLMEIGQRFEKTAHAAISGTYDNEFFASIDTEKPITHLVNITRIRAIVQYANLQFAAQMRQYGAKYKITDAPEDLRELENVEVGDASLTADYGDAKHNQVRVSHEKALEWVQNILERSRGLELPGNFNPSLIAQLFHEQSKPWSTLAAEHVEKIANVCMRFADTLLKSLTTEDIYEKVWARIVEPALKERLTKAHSELDNLVRDKMGHPITYNHYYTTTIQKIRLKKHERKLTSFLEANVTPLDELTEELDSHLLNFSAIKNKLADVGIQEDMVKFSAEDALICQMAYYKDELKYFINAVTKQVVERHLVADLSTDLISAVKFGMMSSDEIKHIASEPATIVQERQFLRKKLQMLEEGIRQFRSALGGF